jgi:hypothetical protein
MLENNLKMQSIKRQEFVSRSSPPTKERLRLRWGACKGTFPQQVRSLSTTFLFFTKAILFTKRQDHNLTNLLFLTTTLGANRRHLASRRQTSKSNRCSMLVDAKLKCSRYGIALVNSQRLSWAHSLNPTQLKDMAWIHKSHKERLGRATKA